MGSPGPWSPASPFASPSSSPASPSPPSLSAPVSELMASDPGGLAQLPPGEGQGQVVAEALEGQEAAAEEATAHGVRGCVLTLRAGFSRRPSVHRATSYCICQYRHTRVVHHTSGHVVSPLFQGKGWGEGHWVRK